MSTEAHQSPLIRRRELLAAGAAIAAWPGAARAQAPVATLQFRPSPTTAPANPLLALVQRSTQGFTKLIWEQAQELGYDGFLEQQLYPESIGDGELDAKLAPLGTLPLTAAQILIQYQGPIQSQIPVRELGQSAILRSLFSNRQLFERTVEFFTDHFNINHFAGSTRILKTVDDREVIRAHAFGLFSDLLSSSAHSAAMLVYLDNNTNVAGAPQENYARELMELHSLGVNGGYTEQDVKEVARAFTGWSSVSFTTPAQFGQFDYVDADHDQDPKTVLGIDLPANGGKQDGDDVLGILADHPATADYVTRKLCRWYLGEGPPEAVVQRAKARWAETAGDLREVVREILSLPSMVAAKPWVNRKLKRPFHFVISLMRAIRATVEDADPLIEELVALGQRPFDWPAPNGYPDSTGAWGGGLHGRWTFASRLLDGEVDGVTVHPGYLVDVLGGPPKKHAATAIDNLLTGGSMSTADRAAVQAYVDSFGQLDWPVLREAIALAASSPSFQWY